MLRDTTPAAAAPLSVRATLSKSACGCSVLRVELDDQLLLYLRVDDLTRGKGVNEDAHLRRDGFNPGRHGTFAGLCTGDDERCQLHGVARTDELASHVTGGGEACPVHDIVQTGLKDPQQVLTGLAGATVRLGVITAELLLQDAVDAGGLLLLTHLKQGLAVLGPRSTVHARWVG